MNKKSIDIAIIGAQKSGTTSVLRFLSNCNEISTHSQQEFSFFVNDEEYNKGYDFIFDDYFPNWREEQKILAKNVGIMYFEKATMRLADHNPQCKLVIILRNPIDRAYSHFWYARQLGFENESSFERALAIEENRIGNSAQYKQHNAYYSRGLYADQLKTVYKYFDPNNVIVELYDDLKSDESLFYKRICDQLDIEFPKSKSSVQNKGGKSKIPLVNNLILQDSPVKWLSKKIIPQRFRKSLGRNLRSWNNTTHRPPSMKTETRNLLLEKYRTPNDELSKLIGKNLDFWK